MKLYNKIINLDVHNIDHKIYFLSCSFLYVDVNTFEKLNFYEKVYYGIGAHKYIKNFISFIKDFKELRSFYSWFLLNDKKINYEKYHNNYIKNLS